MRYLLPSAFLCCAVALTASAQQPAPRPATKRPAAPRAGTTPSHPATPRPTYPPPAPAAGGSAMGNVVKTDPTRNEVIITGRSRNDAPQKIVVNEKTTLVKQVKGSAADLKVGDTIEVTGIPLQIDARTIRVGEISRKPDFHPTKPLPPGAAERADRSSRLPLTRPRLLGRVLKASPLVVQLAEGINAEVKVGAETSIVRVATVPFGSIKQGDPIFALGSRDQNGVLVARRVQVGLEGFPGAGIRSAARPGSTKPPKK